MSEQDENMHHHTYHDFDDAAYMLPNDADERVRLEVQSRYLIAVTENKIVHSPIDPSIPGLRILDVGCGTGAVTKHLGRNFNNATVYGLDLTPVRASDDQPPNVHFLQGNVLTQRPDKWVATDGSYPLRETDERFDLIFVRLLVVGITGWPEFIRSACQLLKPGGYLETHDTALIWYGRSGEIVSGDWPWLTSLKTAGAEKKLDLDCGVKCSQWMEDAGLVTISSDEYRWPWSGTGQETPMLEAFGNFTGSTLPLLYWPAIPKLMANTTSSPDDIRRTQEGMRKQFSTIEEGLHFKYHVAHGRKQG